MKYFIFSLLVVSASAFGDYFSGITCDDDSSNLVEFDMGMTPTGLGGSLYWDGDHPRGNFEFTAQGTMKPEEGELKLNYEWGAEPGSLKYKNGKGTLVFRHSKMEVKCEPIHKKAAKIICSEVGGARSELSVQRIGIETIKLSSQDITGKLTPIDLSAAANPEGYINNKWRPKMDALQIVRLPKDGYFVFSKPVEKPEVTKGWLYWKAMGDKRARPFDCFIDL